MAYGPIIENLIGLEGRTMSATPHPEAHKERFHVRGKERAGACPVQRMLGSGIYMGDLYVVSGKGKDE